MNRLTNKEKEQLFEKISDLLDPINDADYYYALKRREMKALDDYIASENYKKIWGDDT